MNARGTRRPHARTPRSREVDISRRSAGDSGGSNGGGDSSNGGGGDGKSGGCVVLLLVLAAIPALLGALDVMWG